MDIAHLVAYVVVAGTVGGLINCLLTGEFVLPQYDPSTKVWRPGWIGNILTGAFAALVVWAMYGPIASYDLAQTTNPKSLTLTLSQLTVSVLIGTGGGNILTQLAQRQSEQITKNNLLQAVNSTPPPTPPSP